MYKLITFLFLFVFYGDIDNNLQNYPIPPKTKERLFYIQRNYNSNTIVYDANFDVNGKLVKDKPVDVYWIRYEENGQRMELRTFEKKFAFGVKAKKLSSSNEYQIELAAYDKRKLLLRQVSVNKAIAYLKISGKMSILDHLYILADNSSWFPSVKYIELFGYDAETGAKTYEKIKNED